MEAHEAHHHSDLPVRQKGWLRRKWASARLYLLTWLASTGLIATTSTCPFCGQAGCPVGIGQAAGLGLFTAIALGLLMKLGIKKPPKKE